MNVFNRVVSVILFTVLMLLAVFLAVFPVETLMVGERILGAAGDSMANLAASQFWLYVVARVLLLTLAVALFGILVWAELRPQRPRAVRIHTEGGSQAEITADSVARRLAWHIDQLADVVTVTPNVRAHRQSVDVRLDIETSPEVDVPMKTDEVVGVTREVITERMGLQVGKIEVYLKHAPYPVEV